jgi:hypothetical protein
LSFIAKYAKEIQFSDDLTISWIMALDTRYETRSNILKKRT